jgi:hypothetical protein
VVSGIDRSAKAKGIMWQESDGRLILVFSPPDSVGKPTGS